ncbi:MAG: hypothetical protein CMN30_14345 [Sandaracinus sp.]|nr:hypothetical protein [Sandaracinus sp.]|tara:strand:+ start:1681 stop:2274 length:594 start_codon:yes stop_codon:yes gene_type:complete
MHPDTELFARTDGVGLGVRATAPIPRGTLLWVRDAMDVVLSADALAALPEPLLGVARRLGYRNARGEWIVCWDAGKHVNHSCSPTMRGVGHDAMIALADVAPGEEITCDYAECNLDEPLACCCGAPGCRGSIGGPVPEPVWRGWQREVEAAVAASAGSAQPLVPCCVDPHAASVLAGERPVPPLADVAIAPWGQEGP